MSLLLLLVSPSVGVSLSAPFLCRTRCAMHSTPFTPSMCAGDLPAPEGMRLKALKAELDERNVAWRGTCFEKDELVARLIEARANPPTVATEVAAEAVDGADATAQSADSAAMGVDVTADAPGSAGPASSEDESAAYDEAYAPAFEDAMKMKTKQLRTRLAERQLGWADLFEKEELAARLAAAVARSALFSRSGVLVPGRASEVTAEQLRVEMDDDRTPLIVDIYATWCGPCKLLAPQLDALAASLGETLRVAKLDSDAHPELSTELRVAGLPTVLFYRGGREVHRLEGMPPGNDAIMELAREHLGV